MIKKIVLLLLGVQCLVFGTLCFGQRIISDDYDGLTVEFTIDPDQDLFNIPGYGPSQEVGAPNLPTFSSLIEVPLCESIEVTVIGTEYDTLNTKHLPLNTGLLEPLQPSRSKSDTTTHALVINDKIYSTNAFYGVELANVEALGIARDRRLARLQFSPIRYNPVSGQLIVCRKATVKVNYMGVDRKGTEELFERYHSPAFGLGKTTLNRLYGTKPTRESAPVRMLIVAHEMFHGALDEFAEWKRRKGFITDVVYTNEAAVGHSTSSIAAYIKSQYTNATPENPAPTYVLLVGDVEQVPAFAGTTDEHVTDLYYMTWTEGDHLPDCYYGRFSAQSLSQLTPQVEKTLMYEQYTFADPSFLDRAVLVAGVDGGNYGDLGYTHADPAMDYAAIHYVNSDRGFTQVRYFKNNTSIVPDAPGVVIDGNSNEMSETVRGYYNQGAGWVNYSAHGGSTGWGTPSFDNGHVSQMTNTQKFGIMVGNCCLTNKFEEPTCFGEALLRKGNYCGAVGYIGGSNSTYWGEDFTWAIGMRENVGPTMSMDYDAQHTGVYDRFCHTHGEAVEDWITTQGAMVMVGDLTVEASTAGDWMKKYYWEIYHLMGDPSVMPYMTQAEQMTLTAPATINYGTSSIQVTAAPYAYVAITDTLNHTVVAAGFADATGVVTLTLSPDAPFTGYELAASAQQYQTAFQTINVTQPAGPFVTATAITADGPLYAGSTVGVTLTVKNTGNSEAESVTVKLSSMPDITFDHDSIVLGTLAVGEQRDTLLSATVSPSADDQKEGHWQASTRWSTSGHTVSLFPVTTFAPLLSFDYSERTLSLPAGGQTTLQVTVTNHGHAPLQNGQLTLAAAIDNITVTPSSTSPLTIAPSASVTRSYTLAASPSLETGLFVPLTLSLSTLYDTTFQLLTGPAFCETFENNTFHVDGWQQGLKPWEITDNSPIEGHYCLRSKSGLSHNETSEISIMRTSTRIGDSVVFYVKVSSEGGYDKFHFLIDTNKVLTLSGEKGWSRKVFYFPLGTHTLTFRYEKDYSESNGSDCAWVDFIQMPDMPSTDSSAYQLALRDNETFEEASFHLEGWTQGEKPWVFTSETSREGLYSLRSAPEMTDDETSTITLARYIPHSGDSVVFYVKVSSERDYDKFFFRLDGEERCSASGTLEWTRVAIPLTIGMHLFSFEYAKDGSRSNGSDCAWIDLVSLPSGTLPHEPEVGVESGEWRTENREWRAYPNPTMDYVYLSREAATVKVYDLWGRLLGEYRNTSKIDLRNLPAGTYLLNVDGVPMAVVKE